jgi:hypothetical protein
MPLRIRSVFLVAGRMAGEIRMRVVVTEASAAVAPVVAGCPGTCLGNVGS